jgi:hypothetical protein
MAMEPGTEFVVEHDYSSETRPPEVTGRLAGAPSPLAALLDRFTATVTDPEAHTVGDLAETVQALRGELAILAGHFGASDFCQADAGAYSFDALFASDGETAHFEPPVEPGIAASEELEHLCRELSR